MPNIFLRDSIAIRRLYTLSVLTIAYLLLSAPVLFATPFEATLGGYTRGFSDSDSSDSFRVNINTPEGLHEFLFNLQSLEENHSSAKLFQGEQINRRLSRSYRGASADIINSRLRVIFHGRRSGRLYTYTTYLPSIVKPGQRFPLKASFHNRFRNFPCAHATAMGHHGGTATLKAAAKSTDAVYDPPRIIDIATDLDYEFYLKHGPTAKAEVRAILNTAEAIYASQLGLRFNIVSQNVFLTQEQPYTSSIATVLLNQFRSYTNSRKHLGEADIYHLFTGKNLTTSQGSGIVGVAFVGTACKPDNFSFSISQNTDASIQALVAAHEIGHNLNARHPEDVLESPSPSLMSGNIQAGNTQFSDFSIGEIVSYIDQHGDCLAEVSAEARLITSLLAGRRFRATLRLLDNYSDDCTVELYASARRRRLIQNVESAQLLNVSTLNDSRLGLRARMRLGTRNGRRIFFRARVQCGETETYSNIRSIRPLPIVDGRLGTRRWIHNLQRRLSSQ